MWRIRSSVQRGRRKGGQRERGVRRMVTEDKSENQNTHRPKRLNSGVWEGKQRETAALISRRKQSSMLMTARITSNESSGRYVHWGGGNGQGCPRAKIEKADPKSAEAVGDITKRRISAVGTLERVHCNCLATKHFFGLLARSFHGRSHVARCDDSSVEGALAEGRLASPRNRSREYASKR